jgi:hypothetical protein
MTKPTTPRGQLGVTLGDEMADFFVTRTADIGTQGEAREQNDRAR